IVQLLVPHLSGASSNLIYSTAILVLSNLLIVAGTILFGWDVWQIMFLFWFESVSIGIVHFLRFITSAVSPAPDIKNPIRMVSLVFLALFFMVHFNGFNAGHLVFLVVLPALLIRGQQPNFEDTLLEWTGFSKEAYASSGALEVAEPFQLTILAMIFLGHFNSYLVHDVWKKEYRGIEDSKLMMLPYPRIFVMHITIIAGAFLYTSFMALVSQKWAGLLFLSVFVILKMYFDLKTHVKQHKERQERMQNLSLDSEGLPA
ncbi:MAG: hypothetical protein KDK25_08435, partial [Leptospiraceae bacterium]|nr:hypothetical protein [Leptospiraceae bacterium]